VIVPESVRTPFTTEVVRLLSWPLNGVLSANVPVTGTVAAAGCACGTAAVRTGAELAAAAPGSTPTAEIRASAVPAVAILVRNLIVKLLRVEASAAFHG